MNPQYWQAIGAIVVASAALYGVVTAPLLRVIKAESSLTEERIKLLKTELTVEIRATETRLNERIDTRLVHP